MAGGIDKAKIVVVEDEVIVARSLQKKLISMGYDVPAIAKTAEEAIDQVSEHTPDLVLMDVRLEGKMDGIETARLIRNRFGTPSIFLTAYGDEETVQRAKDAEPYGYLLKPFKDKELRVLTEIAITRNRANELLKRRTRQQEAVAEFGRVALAGMAEQALYNEVVRRVAEALGIDCCTILEVSANDKKLVLRAGCGVKSDTLGAAVAEMGRESQAGFALLSSKPVISEDLLKEPRFRMDPSLCEQGMVSGISVILPAPEGIN